MKQTHSMTTTPRLINRFTLFNVAAACLIQLTFALNSVEWNITTLAFYLLTLVGHIGLSGFLLIALPTLLIHAVIRRRLITLITMMLLASLTLYVLLADNIIYYIFHMHINLNIINMLLSPARNQIFNLSWPDCLYIFLILLFVFAAEFMLLYRLIQAAQKKSYQHKLALTGLFISYLLAHLVYAWSDAIVNPAILNASMTVPGFYGLTAKKFMFKHGLLSRSQYQNLQTAQHISKFANKKFHYPLKPLHIKPREKLPNILLIVVDSLRFDKINPQNSPLTYRFSQQSLNFLQHYSSGNCTYAGLFGLFYGVSSDYFNLTRVNHIPPLFFQVLQQHQYQTAIFKGAPLVSPPFVQNVFASLPRGQLTTPPGSANERDKKVTENMIKFLRAQKNSTKPFFSFVFYDSVHAHEAPSTFKTPWEKSSSATNYLLLKQSTTQQKIYYTTYINSVYYVDHLIGKILSSVKKQQLDDNTIIIITADHGEEFNDSGQGYWGHNSSFNRFQTHVPLIVHWPGKPARTIDYQTMHYDIMPTLMNQALGVSNPLEDFSIGYPLFQPNSRPFMLMKSYSRTGIRYDNQLVTIYRSGISKLTDTKGKPLEQQKIDYNILSKAFLLMRRFG